MEQIPWQTIATMVIGLVVPLVTFGAVLWAKINRIEVELKANAELLKRVENAPHNCPYIGMRADHHARIEACERRLDNIDRWKNEINRMLMRSGQKHGIEAEGFDDS
jgi:hypothetical protein